MVFDGAAHRCHCRNIEQHEENLIRFGVFASDVAPSESVSATTGDDKFELVEAADLMKTATHQWTALRRTVKKKVAELADHERFVNAPAN